MTKYEIEKYLFKIEHKLLYDSERIEIRLNREWTKQFPEEVGVYLIREQEEICYIEETENLKERITDILNTQDHSIRINIGEYNFSKLANYKKPNSNKKFPPKIENLVKIWMEYKLTISVLPLSLGRKELEVKVYNIFQPKYKQKIKCKAKTYTKAEIQLIHKQAYKQWTSEADEKLEFLYSKGRTIKELSEVFERKSGAIRARINKLKLKEKYLF